MLRLIPLIAIIFLLPACAETELASHAVKKVQHPIPASKKADGYFKIGKPYRIRGIRYTPRETYNFTQEGIASWYGPNFHGKQTANGETFDKYELTVAHKTLQMPSIIRVTNLENGRSIVARVNDRGPFSKGRILDLSERSAELLDVKKKGTARVRIQVLPEESREVARIAKAGGSTRGFEVALNKKGNTPILAAPARVAQTPPISPRRTPVRPLQKPIQLSNINNPPQPVTKPNAIFVQAGSFTNVVKARALAERVKPFGPARINPAIVNGNQYYRVQLGPILTQSQADTIIAQLSQSKIGEPILIRE